MLGLPIFTARRWQSVVSCIRARRLSGSFFGTASAVVFSLCFVAPVADAQTVQDPTTPESHLAVDFIKDQRDIWTSPLRIKKKDYKWLLPAAAGLAVVMDNDVYIYKGVAVGQSKADHAATFSDAGVVALGGVAGATYFFGRIHSNDHARETGVLAAESLMNTLAVDYALNLTLRRDRPLVGNGRGDFFQPGGDSFPSGHSAVAWGLASIIAREYPGPVTRYGVYGLATGISIARVLGQKHFPSDVIVGGAIGWSIGRDVYQKRHDPDLGGADIGTFHRATREERQPPPVASTYVAMDSWTYDALDRLAALGFIQDQIKGLRPWTRIECAHQVQEAIDHAEAFPYERDTTGVAPLLAELQKEFSPELAGGSTDDVRLESAYLRFTQISGTPLNDSYHFGQTILNDFGRPYWQGSNLIGGGSGIAQHGRFALFVRSEYQHAPDKPAYPFAVRNVIADSDQNPVLPAASIGPINRVALLDAYASVAVSNLQISFGRQSLWWGPSHSGAFLVSNNSEPLTMLRVNQRDPFQLPGFLGYLGKIKTEFFVGKLLGHDFPPGPYINGQKITLKVTPNLEVGFSRTTVFAGDGHPLTLRSFGRSLFSVNSAVGQGGRTDPGDRRGGFDFSYRMPGLRDWLTLYSDSLVDDDVSPLSAPRRAAFNPGLYLSHFPIAGLRKLDLRGEFVNTDPPTGRSMNGQFIYWNDVYHDAYLNNGYLLGNPIGRESKGFQLWSTYWASASTRFQTGYRNVRLSSDFIPGGGTQNSFSAKADFPIRAEFSATVGLQWERWTVPVLANGLTHDVSSLIQFTYHPRSK